MQQRDAGHGSELVRRQRASHASFWTASSAGDRRDCVQWQLLDRVRCWHQTRSEENVSGAAVGRSLKRLRLARFFRAASGTFAGAHEETAGPLLLDNIRRGRCTRPEETVSGTSFLSFVWR